MTTDRPTQPPEANGDNDDLEADPLTHAPPWARQILKSLDLLGQRFSEYENQEKKIKSMIQTVIDNQNDLLSRQNRAERLLLSHDSKLVDNGIRLDDHESRLKALEDKDSRLKVLEDAKH